jgi:DHA1 family bicyclomycin/chloramphenicol resistance-like MFS transporter
MALFTPAMPAIVHAFGTTEAAVKLTLSLYFAGFAFAQLVCGPLSDGFGRKPVTFAFMGVYLVASIGALFAPTIETLILARFVQGFGAAVGVAISRAMVRDLFTHETSARIMNLIGMILAVGPAFAPTLGGFTMEVAGWQAIFVLMVIAGIALVITVHYGMKETVGRDLSRIRPRALIGSYRRLLGTPYFVLCGVVLGGAVGALYTQATVLPFILMDRVGLTATQFGLSMLAQTGSYFLGSVVVRLLIGRFGARRLVPIGLVCLGIGSLLLAVLLRMQAPTFWNVMAPIGIYAFGIAFITPSMTTAALAPYPRIAGSASALNGFFQMGGGLLGGTICAAVGDPVTALATVIPAMGAAAIMAWLFWQRLAEPAVVLE